MHITLESDYAIRIVHTLAREDKRMDAKTISEQTGVTLRFSLKILRKLVTDGIVKSYKGAQGGYELAKPANEISLRKVIEAVEGEYRFSRGLSEGYACTREHSGKCKFQAAFDEISGIVRDKLDTYTFDKLI